MQILIGAEYNIASIAGARNHMENPIFRGTVLRIYRDKSRMTGNVEEMADIHITEYNITNRYKAGDRIDRIITNRLTLVEGRPNKQIKSVLTTFKEDAWYA